MTLASRLAALRSVNCERLRSVRLNACATLMPSSSSASVARDVADRLLARAERAARDEAEQPRDADHDRHDEQRGERELPVDPEHRDERGDEPDRGAEDAAEPLREERVDLADVVDEPAHQVAGLDGLEEADVELLDLGDDVVARVEERALAGGAEREDLLPRGEPAEDRRRHEREAGHAVSARDACRAPRPSRPRRR